MSRDKKKDGRFTSTIKEGDVFTTNQGCKCVVLEYNGAFNVVIQFQDEHGHIKKVSTGCLRDGEVANPFFPAVFGVGYFGIDKGSKCGYSSKSREHMFWKGMFERSYSERSHKRSPTYIDCSVDSRWHNLQKFGNWCQFQTGFKEKGWQLDKDLLSEDSTGKIYSPDVCVFVPQEVNTLFIVPSTKTDGLPTGVSYCKDRDKYQAGCGAGGFRKALGRFTTPELAYKAYLGYKKVRVAEVLEKYSDRLDSRVSDKLFEFINKPELEI